MAKKKASAASRSIAKQMETVIGNRPDDRVYQFRISLDHAHLPIWRQVQTRDVTLNDLHNQIQAAMGWENAHLHQFLDGKVPYLPPSPKGFDFDFSFGRLPKAGDSTRTKLSTLLEGHRKGFKFRYEYDFGDGWMHTLAYEGLVPIEPGAKYPRCIAGENACPPEDCGGVWGYAARMEVLANPDHGDYQEVVDWMGQFDPHEFDLKDANARMPRDTR